MATSKRGGKFAEPPLKKRKLTASKVDTGNKGKQRAYERSTIPIPEARDPDEECVLSDQDVEFFKDQPDAGGFLENLDQEGIARSKKETIRLHNLSKPPRLQQYTDSLPSIDSHDEEDGTWSDDTDITLESASDYQPPFTQRGLDSDEEQPYEQNPRSAHSWSQASKGAIPRLPIKLADGRVMETGERTLKEADSDTDDNASKKVSQKTSTKERHTEDVATGARFGRPSVIAVLSNTSRKERIQLAKEQIATICQDILADPENSLGLLRRLHTFSLLSITASDSEKAIENDPLIRQLAIVSQLAVFKDIIPGYRIRSLTDVEKAEKVSQIVAKTREWEQGLVSVYQTYLRALEAEVKKKTEFAGLALRSMCTLLKEATHFNFRTNLISAVVMRLSKRSWDELSELCLQTLISVFKADNTGIPSLEVVRLLNRMIKERKFAVHPNVLDCLSHLRLKSELGGVRASETQAVKEDNKFKQESRSRLDRKREKGKKVEGPYLSKKARKALKERKEIDLQIQEAEAEVDREEKANMHTETLKLLFVLYFHILKAPNWTPLLSGALEGIARYAHMVNVDFFKDLMQVLKDLIQRSSPEYISVISSDTDPVDSLDIRHKLLCIITAFDLLGGQGEALNIDLQDFVNSLYSLIPSLSSLPCIEKKPSDRYSSISRLSISDLFINALNRALPVQTAGNRSPVRYAAFAKRIATACLSLPDATAFRCLEFLRGLLLSEPQLQALLSTDDRSTNGLYRPDLDDPELSNPFATSLWELSYLMAFHYDSKIKAKSKDLVASDVS